MRHLSIVLCACVLAVCSSAIRAEEMSADDEDKIAAKEDALGDEAMILAQKTVFTGTVLLSSDKPSDRGVVGSFLLPDGKSYPMKSSSDEVMAQLKKWNQKKATVAGKLRVNGKYLVVLAVVETTPSPTPRDKQKRSGL